MNKLTKREILVVSGGEMECFCERKNDQKMERETLGDISSAMCGSVCCGWVINSGWAYSGPDTELSITATGEIESRERAASGTCR